MATIVFVTGASRGFGAAAAEAISREELGDLVLVLLSRDAAGLADAAARARAAAPAARVLCAELDLAALEGIEAGFAAAAERARESLRPGERFARACLVNNAGSGTPVGAVADLGGLAALRAAVDLNVTSCAWLTALFLRFARAEDGLRQEPPAPASWRCAVVNVSSLCAVQPFATMGAYCMGKAARDMLHCVVAAEPLRAGGGGGEPLPVATLNYAPGPMDTALQGEMRSAPGMDAGIRSFFNGLEADGKWVRVDESAARLARTLRRGFTSGAHIDFYDKE
jgi:sepiapterin reductase